MIPRILFVDDEPNVLQGLQCMLHRMRREWEVHFVDSGERALAVLDEQPFDAIVTDMRMPGMDGAELLSEVRRRYPGMIRIILSGYSELEAVMRTVGPAHQYLAKPCQAQALIDLLRRAVELHRMLECEGMRRLLAGLKSLPSPPNTYHALVNYLDDPRASANGMAEIIAKDVAMTAEVLKLTNSAYFTVPTRVTKPLQAVRILGFEALRALVLRIGIFRSFKGLLAMGRLMEDLSRDSFIVARIAQGIAEMEGFDQRQIEEAFCAGMLCSIGLLVLLEHAPKEVRAVADAVAAGADLVEAETKTFGATSFQVGAYLLGLWGFRGAVVEAVALAGRPGSVSAGRFDTAGAVHVAKVLAGPSPAYTVYCNDGAAGILGLDSTYLARVGKASRLEVWSAMATDKLKSCR